MSSISYNKKSFNKFFYRSKSMLYVTRTALEKVFKVGEFCSTYRRDFAALVELAVLNRMDSRIFCSKGFEDTV